MAKKLFVGGLPFTATDAELKDHFSGAGTVVSAQVIMDKFTGRSKGFGFVEMDTDEAAQKAVSMYEGSQMGGRTIRVSEARPKVERPARGGYGDR